MAISMRDADAIEATIALYVAGSVPSAMIAQRNLHAVLDGVRPGLRDHVTLIDVLLQPEKALEAGLLATPSLSVSIDHGPRQWFLGDLRHSDSLRDWIASALRLV